MGNCMYGISTENEIWLVRCTDLGVIEAVNKKDGKESFGLKLFGDNYQYLLRQWDIVPALYISPDCKYIIVTYGIGYVYFISIEEKEVVKFFQMFSDISYEDDSYRKIDHCCYYSEKTWVDFSHTGRYAAVRVRGDFDPQESDGHGFMFTPIYIRSVFIIDLFKLELCFKEDFGDIAENGGRNVAAIAFSPNDKYFVAGTLGNAVKAFCLSDKLCIGNFEKLAWVGDPLGVDNCWLIAFLDENNFVYVNIDNDIVRATLQDNHRFEESGIIRVNVPKDHAVSKGVYDKWSYTREIRIEQDEIICYMDGNRQEYKGPIGHKLQFEDI